MVYISNITDSQPIFVPRSRPGISGRLILKLRSTVGLEYVVEAETLDLDVSSLYYRIAVVLPEGVPDGEYEYTLTDNTGTLSSGIVYVGAFDQPRQTDNTITYEQTEI